MKHTIHAVVLTLTFGISAACGDGSGGNDGAGGSGGGGSPGCLAEPADGTCDKALYGLSAGEIAPTFDQVYERTLVLKCGNSTACHAGDTAQKGLRFDEGADAAFTALQGNASDGTPFVTPGDLQCGEIIARLESPDPAYSMPSRGQLDEQERCAIRHWIANGATR
jgi:hypothetical protein